MPAVLPQIGEQGEGSRISRQAHELECDLEPHPHGLAALMGGQHPWLGA